MTRTMTDMTEPQQHEGLKYMLQVLSSKFSIALANSDTARMAYACVDQDSEAAGQFTITAFTELGDKFGGKVHLLSDAQSGPLEQFQSTEDVDEPNFAEERTCSEMWDQVRNESATIQDRIEALHSLLDTDRSNATQYLADELNRGSTDDSWTVALVFLAEDVHFPAELQQTVKSVLLRIAHCLYKSSKASRVVWSAIRRASSLLSPAEARLLLPFLERDGVVDARAVTLMCVEKMFLPSPPVNPEIVRPIGDRAHTLATKLLDPEVFCGGEQALLAQSAVCTLASIGDARFGHALRLAAGLNRRWLVHQLRCRLEDLRATWQAKGPSIIGSNAFRSLESELNWFETSSRE